MGLFIIITLLTKVWYFLLNKNILVNLVILGLNNKMIENMNLKLVILESISIFVNFYLILSVCIILVEVDFEKEEPEMGTLLVEHGHEALKETRVLRGNTFKQSHNFRLFLQQRWRQSWLDGAGVVLLF